MGYEKSLSCIISAFARVCEQSTDFHFPDLDQQFLIIEHELSLANEHRVQRKQAEEGDKISIKSSGSSGSNDTQVNYVSGLVNLPPLCRGTGISTPVSKIFSPRLDLMSRGCSTSLTRGWISLSLYKVVVDYFSSTPLQSPYKKTKSYTKNSYRTFSNQKLATFWCLIIVETKTSLCDLHFCFVFYGVVGDNPLETGLWILITTHENIYPW